MKNFRRLVAVLLAVFVALTLLFPATAVLVQYLIPGGMLLLVGQDIAAKHRVQKKKLKLVEENRKRERCPVCGQLPPENMVYCSDECRKQAWSKLPTSSGVSVSGGSGFTLASTHMRYVNGEYIAGEYVNGAWVDDPVPDRNHGLSDAEVAEFSEDEGTRMIREADEAAAGYVPEGQAELAANLLRHLKQQVAAMVTASRGRPRDLEAHWVMSRAWYREVRALRTNGLSGALAWEPGIYTLYGYTVHVEDGAGVPELVQDPDLPAAAPGPEPERGTPAAQVAAVAEERAWRLRRRARDLSYYLGRADGELVAGEPGA